MSILSTSKMRSVIVVVLFTYLQSLHCHDEKRPKNSRLNFFDTDLLRYLAEEKKENVMVSPASIKSTLAMILEGANGVTADEIRNALRLSPNKNEFREQLNLYLSMLQSNTKGVQLEKANTVFVSTKHKLRKDYEMTLQKAYFTEINKIDFKDPGAASDIINNWVKNKTKGLISNIVEPVDISSSSDIVLVNAIYFKSCWQHGFDPRHTRKACFYLQEGCRNVAMMELHADLNYAFVDNLRAHAVELPYQGGRYSMILLVPQDKGGCASLIRDLPYVSLHEVSKLMEPADVLLSMPKFTVDYSEDMVAPLRSMLINSLFSATANLTGIFEQDSPQVNGIYHKVHISVDEIGTEAAAASSAMVIPLIESGVQILVDHPFLFFIRDNLTGLTLFEGKIEEPNAYVDQNSLKGLPVNKNTKNTIRKSSSRY